MKCRKWKLFTVMIVLAAVLCAAAYAKKCEKGEESGIELALNETYNQVRNGARLILSYDAKSNAFKGTVENTTNKTLKQVRVEVHLSNGTELGPTTPGDLGPGEKRGVKLTTTSKNFNRWTAHPEVGIGEHGSAEGRGEHVREGQSQHERQVTESQVPAKALAVLKKMAAGAKFTGFAEEIEHGSTFYEGSWKTPSGANMDVLVTPTGALVEIEKQIKTDKVPAEVLKVVREAAGKGTELMFEKKTMIQYEVKFGKGEHSHEMLLTPDGRLVEQELWKGKSDDAGAGKERGEHKGKKDSDDDDGDDDKEKCEHKAKKGTGDYKGKCEHKFKKSTGDDKEKCEHKSKKSTHDDKEKCEHKSKKDSNDDDDKGTGKCKKQGK